MGELALPADERAATPLWRNLNFTLMWTSVAASGFGDRMIQLVALALLGVHAADAQAASMQAAITFWFFLPYVIVTPPAGWLADTMPRKWIMFGCDQGRALVLLVALLLVPAGAAAAVPGEHHWKVYAIIAAVGTLAAIFSPTKQAVIPQIVPLRQLQAGNAIILGIAVIASLIGLMVGGPVVEKFSSRAGLLVAVLAFGVSGWFFVFMHFRRHAKTVTGPQPGQLARLLQAAGYIRRHRPLLELLWLSILFWGAAHVLMAAIAALCKNNYGLPRDQVLSRMGFMMAILGTGMLTSSLWVAWINTRRESGWFTMLCLALAGVGMFGMAVSRSYHLSLVLAFAVGFFGNAAMICVATLTQSITPNYILGRVAGVRDLVTTIWSVGINLLIWRLANADAWMIPALYLLAAVLVGVGLWGALRGLTRGPLPNRKALLFWRLTRAYVMVWHRARWIGKQQVPAAGAVILAANHPTGIDPLLMQAAVPRIVRWVMLDQYRYRLLTPLWRAIEPITLSRSSRDLARMRQVLDELRRGQIIGLFPEGALQREHRNLQPFEAGIAMLAVRSGAVIVPVWISGTPRARRILWHFLRPSRSTVVFGQPYKPDPDMTYEQIMADLRRRMLELAHALPEASIGVATTC